MESNEQNTDAEKANDFWNLAERFINLANEQAQELSPDMVNSALQYAAARFNAFIVATNSEELEDERDEAVRYLTNHYRELLRESLNDYIENPPEKAKQ